MKIAFLNHFISGGGAERVTCLLANKMVDRGHEVAIMTNLFKPFTYSVNEKVRKIPLFKSESESKSKVSLLYMVLNTRKVLKSENPDVIIGVMPLMSLVAVIAAVGLKTKVVASDHTSFERKLPLHINLIRKYVYKLADVVTVLTQADYNYLGKSLPRKVVMPNPLAYQCISEVSGLRNKNIVAIGRVDYWQVKGFDLLIEAWSKIAQKHTDWTLEIAGGGNDKSNETLHKIIKEWHVEGQTRLLGFRKDVDKILRESSIFVLSSRVEGFGMVLIEAMSQGCACISFDDGGRQKEIITNDKEGVIIETHDVNSLAKAMENVIVNDKLRLALSKAAIKRASDFSIDIIEERWEKVIESIIRR